MDGTAIRLNESRPLAIQQKRITAVRPERVEPPFDTLRANGTLNLMTLPWTGEMEFHRT